MISLKEQEGIFNLIGDKLKKQITAILIGGSAMIYHGTKEATKDIDIVFSDEDEREEVITALKELGFKERDSRILYSNRKDLPILLQRGDERIDLFCRKIIYFKLSESMIERADGVYEHKNLIIKTLSPEDIFLLKCVTERAGDRKDAMEILKRHDLNWKTIFDESLHQTEIGEDVFPVYLYDFLMELKEDLGADIPDSVIKEIRKIGEKAMERVLLRKKMKTGKKRNNH